MRFFHILAQWRLIPQLVEQNAALLQADITTLLSTHGLTPLAQTGQECLVFALWSADVAMINAQEDRLAWKVAAWTFHRRVGRLGERLSRTMQIDPAGIEHVYRRRTIEVLATIRSVFLTQGPAGPALPLSIRSARLFLQKIVHVQPARRQALAEELLPLLKSRGWACAAPLLSAGA
jgi:hypothetical protein